MGAGLLAVKSGFILFIKNYQFPIQINTLERERDTVLTELFSLHAEFSEMRNKRRTKKKDEMKKRRK